MTTDEKVDKILEIVLPLVPMVQSHDQTLYGNGQPGLKEEVALTMQRQNDCPARKAVTAEGKRLNLAYAALVVAVISCIASAVFGAVSFFTQK
ncbi:hypothetical protein CMI37_17225 [Candidatus Pacearchaeota archaeon]|nr:hypothetical protein [Candidatus Pacearchaeota archaeon]|tara:strand:- start:1363 stop:1641 length:279 start_codon:yes stop_codon:yes gene_type:complete